MQTLITIAPIFIILALGWVAAKTGFLPEEVQSHLNRLVYYFAIPAFLFRAISSAPLAQGFNVTVLMITLGSALSFYLTGWLLCKTARVSPAKAGVIVQTSCHGNLGYIGLPIAFYFLGDIGLAQAGIISGFLMILQNIMSVTVLQSFSGAGAGKKSPILVKLLQNPVIVASMLGILASGLQIPIPDVINRTLSMLGHLAPPAALLLIGASLSFRTIWDHKTAIITATMAKLVFLPALGLCLFTLLGIASTDYLPAMILLGTPTATVAYVLSRQMNADSGLAVAAISASTLLSALSLSLWLTILTR